jgi:hypothetical protein
VAGLGVGKNLIALPPRPEHNEYMLSKVCSAAVSGIDAYPVEVEVNTGYGDSVVVIFVNKTPKAVQSDFFGGRL